VAEFYITNRELVKNLSINTGTSANPTYTPICTTSEISIETDFEEKDWYVFCDSLQRKLLTGASVVLSGTLKLDVNNTGDMALLSKVHTLLADGEIAQFNNQQIKFDLLSSVASDVLTYTTYTANVVMVLNDLGGSAEDESEFSFEMTLIGTATAG
jgi:hypothetical protein